MRIHLIRHADPDYSIDSLTPKGHAEARALAAWLQQEGRITRIFSSPLGRAKATARYTAEALELPVTIEDWTREISEFWQPEHERVAWDIAGSELLPLYAEKQAHWHTYDGVAELPIESHCAMIAQESDRWLASLGYERDGEIYRIRERNEETIALFAHGGFGLTWLAHLTRVPTPLFWSGFFLHPSSITTILFDERVPGIATPRLIWVGNLPHLAVDGQEPAPAGIKANYY
jgi:broad specificity phosphatase PhoE